MEVKINDKPIEYYFGENIVCKSVGKCVKYYVGSTLLVSTNCALFGGIVGGIIGASITRDSLNKVSQYSAKKV
jgi:hypothetical protein